MSDPTGGPAFPLDSTAVAYGMTLRDYFAAKAMQSLIALQSISENYDDENNTDTAVRAYLIAVCMIEARNDAADTDFAS